MTALHPRAAVVAALVLASAQAHAADPLNDTIAPGAESCFRREYDAAHLRGHPRQSVVSMTLWLKTEADRSAGRTLGIGIAQRGESDPLFAQGGCSWESSANRDTSGKRLIPALKKDSGVACIMLAEPEVFESLSAEEGGFLLFDSGKDRDLLMVHLDDGLTMVKRRDRSKQVSVRFGTDDRVFLLRRTGIEDCAAVKDAITTLEPGVARGRR